MKFLLILCLVLFAQPGKAQNVTFDQLISLQSKNLEYINEFLIARGWEFNGSKAETDEDLGEARWSFGKSAYDDKAKGWFNLGYSVGYQSTIDYQIHNKFQYTQMKSRMNALGMKVVLSEIQDSGLFSVYLGKNYAVKVKSSISEENSVPTYIFTILTKQRYLNSLENSRD